jgi:transposase-like protein
MNIDDIKAAISQLSEDERKKLLSDVQLEHFSKGSYIEDALQDQEKDVAHSCPRCGSMNIWSRGTYKGVKRLKCNDCSKYFSSTSGTAIYHIHNKDKWQAYLQCMKKGLTLRESASEVSICLQTAFNWRHKILSSLSKVESDHFTGIVEADELYLLFSEKGKRNLERAPRKRGNENAKTLKENKLGVLVATDRTGNKMARVVGRSTMNKKALEEALGGKVDKSAVLCTDSYKVYQGLAKREGLNHVAVSSLGKPTQKNKAFHIQTVNSTHSAIRKFLGRYNGVSTKYLQNYLHWFIASSEKKIKETEKLKLWLWLSMTIEALQILNKLKATVL